ncbi:MAG TPA: hypothetical protein VE983_06170 [Solirubrobacteraceae bacterium]|nr:hypothetical protein [Solirubrobacteraceae bacterium]
MTLVIVLNALLVVLVLGTVVGLHVWAIVTSSPQQPTPGQLRSRQPVRARSGRRQSATRRLGGALALR